MPVTSSFLPRTLSDQIYQELKRRMVTCELAPGSRLIEKALCDELGVSRASLREALNRLAQERLAVLKPNFKSCRWEAVLSTYNLLD